VLLVGPAVATTIVEEDVDGRPPGGAAGESGNDHYFVGEDVDGGPL
jgi:hypothetical protein